MLIYKNELAIFTLLNNHISTVCKYIGIGLVNATNNKNNLHLTSDIKFGFVPMTKINEYQPLLSQIFDIQTSRLPMF